MAKEYLIAFAIGAKLQGQFGTAFKSAQSSVVTLQNKIESLNRKQGDISAYQKQQRAVEQTRSKLETLQKQYENLRSEMGQNGEASASLKNAMLQKQLQIERTTASLEGQERKLGSMGSALSDAGVNTGSLAQESKALAAELDNLKGQQEEIAAASQNMGQSMSEAASSMEQMLAAVGVTAALKAGYDLMRECTQASIEFETGMAGVQRTVGGSQQFLDSLGESFKEMGTVIPITNEALTGIATTAGQLGIAQKDVESFTTVMAKLDTTTDLTAESAATMLAQFSNITGVTQYDRLGAVVADLGDATATTASKVVEMSQGMASAAHLAGMGATDILGISAAVGSLGVEAQAGSTAMSTLISTLHKAVETGDGLNDFASVANMTAEQFKTAWAENAAGALNTFIQGLNDTERNGRSAIVILDDLGITNVRQTKAILGLASAGNLLNSTITQANAAWQQNTALNEKAAVMYGTTQSKLTMAQNAANNLKIAVGDALTPAIGAGAAAFTSLIQPMAQFIQRHPALVKAVTAAAGVIGAATLAVTGYAAAAKIAAAASALFSSTITGLPIIMGVTAGIAAITAGVILLADAFRDTQETMEDLDAEFTDLNVEFRRQGNIKALCEEYKQLQDNLYGVSGAAYELGQASETPIALQITAEVAEGFSKMTVDDFVDGNYVYLTAEAAEGFTKLTADEFCDGTLVTLTAEAGKSLLNSELLLEDTTVYLTADAAEEAKKALPPEVFLEDGAVMLTPEVREYLEANQFLLENSAVQLTPAIAEHLNANGFLEGSEVELSGKALQTLAGKDFMQGTDVYLSPEALRKMRAKDLIDGDTKIQIQGIPNGAITVDDYIAASDRVVELTANVSNLAEVQQAISALQTEAEGLKDKAAAAKTELNDAQAQLTDMQTRQSQLEARLTHANTDADRGAIQAAIEAQTEAIAAQETKVGELENAYATAATQYALTQAAAEELTQKEQRLAEVQAELSNVTDGAVSATAAETGEIEKQIQKVYELAEAKRAEIRTQVRSNVAKQATLYANAVSDAAANQIQLNNAMQQASRFQQLLTMSADDMKAALLEAQEGLYQLGRENGGIDWKSEDARAYAQQINDIWKLATGQDFDVKAKFHQLANEMQRVDWTGVYGNYDELAVDVGDYEEALLAAQAVQKQFIDNLVSGVQDGGMSMEDMESTVRSAFTGIENGAELAEEAIRLVRAALGEANTAAEEMGESTGASAAEVTAAIQPVLDKMNALSEAYTAAYDAAYKSMDGQFKLFEEAPVLTQESVDQMIAALQSQAAYMAEYSANLKAAGEMGLSDGLLAQLSDGSKESAAYLAAIVSDGAGKIDELNAAFASVEEGKETFADTVATMQTDFQASMQALSSELASVITTMDMSADAAQAGADTVQAFADAAEGKLGTVSSAFSKVAIAAKKALAIAGGIPDGYATGTESAERGFKMVGEKGPEIVFFNGGEKVLNAQETAAYQREHALQAEPVGSSAPGAGGPHIEIKPVYNLSGNMDADQIRAVLDAHTEELREMVRDTMDEVESDRERSVYS